jgi:hypothetical protein
MGTQMPPQEKTMGTSMPAGENKVAHTLKSTIKIRERERES